MNTQEEYFEYLEAFNSRNYVQLETFFADDFVLENAGFKVSGKHEFREFYKFFHSYCRETVSFKGYYAGTNGFVANVVIRFEGLQDLSAEKLAELGYSGMTPVAKDTAVDVEFLILYCLNSNNKIQHIKGAVWFPAVA